MIKFLEAVGEKNYREAARSALHFFSSRITIPKEYLVKYPEFNGLLSQIRAFMLEKLSARFEIIMKDWYENILHPEKPLYERSASVYFFKLLEEAGKLGIKMPRELFLFLRTLAIIDMVALKIDNSFDLLNAIREFLEENKKEIEKTKENLSLEVLQERLQKIEKFSKNKALQEIILEKQLNWILSLASREKGIYELLPVHLQKMV
jgi:predicted unusual protein kinase regulating ubiquinone biosynthesis (AarF/ABC1/UbiB family)